MSLKRPHYFTPNEDTAIRELFPIVSTEKLSILMNLKQETIIKRFHYLSREIKQ